MRDAILTLRVGEVHPALTRRIPMPDGCVAGILGRIPALVLALNNAAPVEVAAVEHGAMALGLVPLPPWGYVWLLALEHAGTHEATYSPMADQIHQRQLAEPEGDSLAIIVHLVDGASGKILAMRALGAPAHFTAKLRHLHSAALSYGDSFRRSGWEGCCRHYTNTHARPADGMRDAVAVFRVPPVGSA